MRPSNPILMNAVANTAGAKHSIVIPARNIVTGSIQAIFSDNTSAGTLVLECSNDPPDGLAVDSQGQPIPVNWDTVKNGATSMSASVASGALTTISAQWLNFAWLRVTWTRSGGAGTLNVNGFFQGPN